MTRTRGLETQVEESNKEQSTINRLHELLIGMNKCVEEPNKQLRQYLEELNRRIRQDISKTNKQATETNKKIDALDKEMKRMQVILEASSSKVRTWN